MTVRRFKRKPHSCTHLLVYEWKQLADGTEVETLQCILCHAYIVDEKAMNRLRDFAWNTPFTEDEDDDQ